jgi:hypothetical protein
MAAVPAEWRKQLAKLQRMNAILKNCRLLQRGGLMQYQLIQNHQWEFRADESCGSPVPLTYTPKVVEVI